ncbi:MAG: hypothetical protein AVDCRST_MAG04-1201 [uncultured Acetobacteraceae bacterium]|uniref:Uncharacterized protein n=1 Tax=uncultured Acetobacteraceae bacterium TaxID=169975 RepID=A0A6J4HSD9_9PROT|nr:MAG: hypothetical protein AVDCRST_MAG04-1201 [uncultured Acetobacteraceae bacterium]
MRTSAWCGDSVSISSNGAEMREWARPRREPLERRAPHGTENRMTTR